MTSESRIPYKKPPIAGAEALNEAMAASARPLIIAEKDVLPPVQLALEPNDIEEHITRPEALKKALENLARAGAGALKKALANLAIVGVAVRAAAALPQIQLALEPNDIEELITRAEALKKAMGAAALKQALAAAAQPIQLNLKDIDLKEHTEAQALQQALAAEASKQALAAAAQPIQLNLKDIDLKEHTEAQALQQALAAEASKQALAAAAQPMIIEEEAALAPTTPKDEDGSKPPKRDWGDRVTSSSVRGPKVTRS